MRCALLFLVPALALSGCGSTYMTSEQAIALYGTDDPATVAAIQRQKLDRTMADVDRSNARLWGQVQQGNTLIRQGQQSTPEIQPYSYQRTEGVWVYCNRTSSYTVACRTN